jgi:hypothetical protein
MRSILVRWVLLVAFAAVERFASSVAAAPPIWEPNFGTNLNLTDDSTIGQTFASLNFTFPFVGVTYSGAQELFVASNGFISLGSDNGADCCSGDPVQLVAEYPRIAAFWADHNPTAGGDVYLNYFNDDADPESERVVITWDDVLFDNGLPINVQIQLVDDGTVIMGFNGWDLTNFNDNTLVGLSPGGGVADPGSTDFTATLPFNTGSEPTVYELFMGTPPPIDLDQQNIVFVPNGQGGWGADVPVELLGFTVE